MKFYKKGDLNMKKNFMKTPTLYAVVFASLLMAGCNNSSDKTKIETEVTDTSETDEIKDDDINKKNTVKVTKK